MDNMQAMHILSILTKYHEGAKCELEYTNPFELLIAVMLSAQSTDKRVNIVTKELFKKYKNPEDFANAKIEELEKAIYSCGFYKNKAKNIINASKEIINTFNGKVPNNQKDLETLPGVGRKTANVVYSVAFGGDAIAVDTHVFRVSNRIGLVNAKDPEKTEIALMKIIDKSVWSHAHHVLIFHGRYVCKSQNPNCSECPVLKECEYNKKNIRGKEV